MPGFFRAGLLILSLLVISSTARGQETPPFPAGPDSVAHVTYLTGGLVYLDAGREDGLEVGRQLSVEREGVVVATIKVEHVASHRASCSILGTGEAPREGDVIRYVPQPKRESRTSSPTSAPVQVKAGRDGGSLRELGLRGRAGVRYLTTLDQTDFGADFTQPSLDLLLTGSAVAGSPFSFAIDTRARRTYRTHADGSRTDDGRTRVYRLNASHHAAGSPLRISLGRQVSPDLASVSLFDGALVEVERGSKAWGLFGGTQPDPESYGYSSRVLEYGTYARVQSSQGHTLKWSATGGGIRSLVDGARDRDYVFLRGQLMNARVYGYVSQEIDVDEWRASEGDRRLFSPTSTYAGFRWQAVEWLSLDAGFDNRRSVRLYQDRETPETEFDYSYRQGLRGGATLRLRNRYTLGTSAQTNRGGSGGSSDSYTITSRAARVSPLSIDLASRHTRFTGPLTEGWLHSATVAAPIGPRRRVEFEGGRRQETRSFGPATSVATTWYGVNADVGLWSGWYFLLSVTSTRGDTEKNDQIYSSLSYRF